MTAAQLIAAWVYALTASIQGVFDELNLIKCHKCGCRHRVSTNHQYIAMLENGMGPLCEFEETCAECGFVMNYWAYGYYAYPTTYTELIGLRWFMFKSNVKHFFHWRLFK